MDGLKRPKNKVKEVSYLGVLLHNKLTKRVHIEGICYLMTMQKSCKLTTQVVNWLLAYSSVVWWAGLKTATAKKLITQVQR